LQETRFSWEKFISQQEQEKFDGTKEIREGWPLMTVETEANKDLGSTNEVGPSLAGSLGLPYRYKKFFILPWLLWSALYKIFFPHVHYFGLCVPIAQQPGLCTGQAVVQGHLSLNACFHCTVAFPTFFYRQLLQIYGTH
jgi:hypothetical protein